MECGGTVYVYTLRVFKRCLMRDSKPDKNKVVCCSIVLTGICIGCFLEKWHKIKFAVTKLKRKSKE